MVRAPSGLKRILTKRLGKLQQVFQCDHETPESTVYLVEEESKHPDRWEKRDDHTWVRHHEVPRRDLFIPAGIAEGPPLDDLEDIRVTEREYPDGTRDRIQDAWKDTEPVTTDISLWRGRTIFYVKGTPVQKPKGLVNTPHSGYP